MVPSKTTVPVCRVAEGPVFESGLSCRRRAQSALSSRYSEWWLGYQQSCQLAAALLEWGLLSSQELLAVCSPTGGERLSERHGECVGGRDGQEADGVPQ